MNIISASLWLPDFIARLIGEDWRGMAGLVLFAEGVVASVQDLDLAERHFETAAETYRLFELVWRESDVFY
jgi:hypothetical protein